MKNCLKIIFSIFLFLLFIPLFIKAITFENPFKNVTFEKLIKNIFDFIFWVTMAVAPIMIIVAAFYFLTSGGNPEKVNKAKKIVFFTFLGLIIVLLARGIISVIEQLLRGSPNPPPSTSYCSDLVHKIQLSFGAGCGYQKYDPVADVDKDQDVDDMDMRSVVFGCRTDENCCKALWSLANPCPCSVSFDKETYVLGETMTINFINAPAPVSELTLTGPNMGAGWTVRGNGYETFTANPEGVWTATLQAHPDPATCSVSDSANVSP